MVEEGLRKRNIREKERQIEGKEKREGKGQ